MSAPGCASAAALLLSSVRWTDAVIRAGHDDAQNVPGKARRSVSTQDSNPADPIRAAIISPEILLNGYVEGRVEKGTTDPSGTLVLRFENLIYKGKSTAIDSELVDWLNSKGHKAVDYDERPIRLENGALLSKGPELWLDEGAEPRVKAGPNRGADMLMICLRLVLEGLPHFASCDGASLYLTLITRLR